MDENISFRALVDVAKMRWRIERDYQELKQEIGLRHYEGRGWLGFHHHGTLCIAAYGFLISEREMIPPQDLIPPGCSKNLPFPTVADPAAPPIRPQRHVPKNGFVEPSLLVRAIVQARKSATNRVACSRFSSLNLVLAKLLNIRE